MPTTQKVQGCSQECVPVHSTCIVFSMLSKDRAIEFTKQFAFQSGNVDDNLLEDVISGKKCLRISQLCRLWAGMGSIYKISIGDNAATQFVVKHVTPPPPSQQSFGDQRKSKSYQVEANFYQYVAPELIASSHRSLLLMPIPYSVEYGPKEDEITICMSYLEGSWIQSSSTSRDDVQGTLRWLAQFHAAYWGEDTIHQLVQTAGLQEIGSYWHLDTRPDEHASMTRKGWQGRLKRAAKAIDQCLKRDPMQCLIHGDPKEANVMKLNNNNDNNDSSSSSRSNRHQQQQDNIAMYDFQYCGKGTPTRDLAYFLCSSCDDDWEDELVQYYYEQLSQQLNQQGITPPTLDHFRKSLLLAFCDFHRFLCGWGQWGYDLQDKVLSLLQILDNGKDLGSDEAYHEAIQKHFW